METQPGNKLLIKGLTQVDQNFQIPLVDLQANDQYDLRLINSVSASMKTDSYGQGGTHR